MSPAASGNKPDPAELPLLHRAGHVHLPLWLQVADSVRDFANQHAVERPVRLPTEAELAEHYDVSLSTVRQALAVLDGEGLLSRHRRRGTYVHAGEVQSRPLQLRGPLDSVIHQQATDETVVLGRAEVPVPDELHDVFPDVARLVEFQRVRYSDGMVLNYARNFLRSDIADRIDVADLRSGSMTQLLRDRLGLRLARIENEIEASLATPSIAALLELEPRSPVLISRNKTVDTEGDVVDAAFIYYRGDRFRFSLTVDLT
jgi:GntR family transcriptional regulator